MSEEADAEVTATLSGITVTLSGSGDYDSRDYNSNTDITKLVIGNKVTGIGSNAFYGCESLETVKFGSSLTYIGNQAFYNCYALKSVVLPDSMRTIEYMAFRSCTSLTSLDLGEGIEYINSQAFSYCTSLESVHFPASLMMVPDRGFVNCTALKNVTFDEDFSGLIGSYAFTRDNIISFVEFPDYIQAIGSKPFEIEFYEGDTQIGQTPEELEGKVFVGDYYYLYCQDVAEGDTFTVDGLNYTVTGLSPDKVAVVGYTSDASLTNLVIPESVEYNGHEFDVVSVSYKAFYGCTKIKTLDLGSVQVVNNRGFANCTRITSIDLGDSLRTIGAYAFFKCLRTTSINFDDCAGTLTSYGKYCFYYCNSVESFAIPSGITSIGSGAFSVDFYKENGTTKLKATAAYLDGYYYNLTDGKYVRQANVTVGKEFTSGRLNYVVTSSLPAEAALVGYNGDITAFTVGTTRNVDGYAVKITSIAKGALKGMTTLVKVNTNLVETIDPMAFYGCKNLKEIIMPNVTSIGTKAFARCSSLEEVTFGGDIRSISAYTFFNCSSLTEIKIPNTVRVIGSYSFYGCDALSEISLGSSVKTIGAGAFTGCPNITDIAISSTLKSIGTDAFADMTFYDYDSNEISKTAANLARGYFSGTTSSELYLW